MKKNIIAILHHSVQAIKIQLNNTDSARLVKTPGVSGNKI